MDIANEKHVIVTFKSMNALDMEDDFISTSTFHAIPISRLERTIDSFEASEALKNRSIEFVEIRKTRNEDEDQRAFAEEWNRIRDDRGIQFTQKFHSLYQSYQCETVRLMQTERVRNAMREQASTKRIRNQMAETPQQLQG